MEEAVKRKEHPLDLFMTATECGLARNDGHPCGWIDYFKDPYGGKDEVTISIHSMCSTSAASITIFDVDALIKLLSKKESTRPVGALDKTEFFEKSGVSPFGGWNVKSPDHTKMFWVHRFGDGTLRLYCEAGVGDDVCSEVGFSVPDVEAFHKWLGEEIEEAKRHDK